MCSVHGPEGWGQHDINAFKFSFIPRRTLFSRTINSMTHWLDQSTRDADWGVRRFSKFPFERPELSNLKSASALTPPLHNTSYDVLLRNLKKNKKFCVVLEQMETSKQNPLKTLEGVTWDSGAHLTCIWTVSLHVSINSKGLAKRTTKSKSWNHQN